MLEIITNYSNLFTVVGLLFNFGLLNGVAQAVSRKPQDDRNLWLILVVSNGVEALMFGKLGWDAIQFSGVDGSMFVWMSVAVGTIGALFETVLAVKHFQTFRVIIPVYAEEQHLLEAHDMAEIPEADTDPHVIKDSAWLAKRDRINILGWL